MMFPSEKIVVEILEDVEPIPDVIDACHEMAQKGYRIALDDFLFKPQIEPLAAMADIIKCDLRATPADELETLTRRLSGYKARLLAEKVETHEEFEGAVDLGFELFQGYFFSRPQILSGKDISSNSMHLLQIMAEANKDTVDFNELEKLITRDVAIPYKLLRYINSAYFRRANNISSIKQAITLLGENGTRRFISLIAMTRLAPNKPNELIRLSIIRARFCETLGTLGRSAVDPSNLFMLGLFSLIDAILDNPMEGLMERLPLSEEIGQALVSGTGPLNDYLETVKSYEKRDWDAISRFSAHFGLDEKALPRHYMEALAWADEFVEI